MIDEKMQLSVINNTIKSLKDLKRVGKMSFETSEEYGKAINALILLREELLKGSR